MSYWSLKKEMKEYLEKTPESMLKKVSDMLLGLAVIIADIDREEERKKKENKP